MSEQKPFAFSRSVSQRRTWLECGQKFVLKYGAGWKFPHDRGIFAVGIDYQDTLNAVIDGRITADQAPGMFSAKWRARGTQTPPLHWSPKAKVGYKEIEARLPILVQKSLASIEGTLRLGNHGFLDKPLVYELAPGVAGNGRPDFYGEGYDMWRFLPEPLRSDPAWKEYLAGWTPGILDFKTSGSRYNELEAELDDQLTEYQVALSLDKQTRHYPSPRWVALHVGIYTATPDAQWLVSPARTPEEVSAHIHTAVAIDQMIVNQIFPRNVGACFAMGQCEMVPVCYPSQQGRIGTDIVRAGRQNIADTATDLL